jgi:hypothetical protein
MSASFIFNLRPMNATALASLSGKLTVASLSALALVMQNFVKAIALHPTYETGENA